MFQLFLRKKDCKTKCESRAIQNATAHVYVGIKNDYVQRSGPGSSVDIATDYGLEGSGSNPSGDEIFRPSRPALGPTQPPV